MKMFNRSTDDIVTRDKLFTAIAAVDQHTSTAAAIQKAVDAVQEALGPDIDQKVTDAAKAIKERGQRRADAMWAVWRAKAHDGRGIEPPTSHDADVAWTIAEMLNTVAGLSGAAVEPISRGEQAGNAGETTRVLSPLVEAGMGGN